MTYLKPFYVCKSLIPIGILTFSFTLLFLITAGVYCEWKLTEQSIAAAANGAVASCFEEYKMDLYLSCNEDQPYTEYTFTPDSDTPDLLYYQVSYLIDICLSVHT